MKTDELSLITHGGRNQFLKVFSDALMLAVAHEHAPTHNSLNK